MKKGLVLLTVAAMTVCSFAPVYGEESAQDTMSQAYLTFKNDAEEVTGGVLTWDEETMEWEADFPSIFGTIVMKGTYDENGDMTVTEDGTGGYDFAYIPGIQEIFDQAIEGKKIAPLSFENDAEEVEGGVLSWDENAMEWEADFPSIFGSIVMSGTYSEDGTMEVVEDGTGGYAFAYLPPIQEVFTAALAGEYQTGSIAAVLPDNELSLAVEACEDIADNWKPTIVDIAKQYDPAVRNHDTIFYGASNFAFWKSIEDDLAPYDVQNHAFGGSTDKDLYNWAPYMLYPYDPVCVFFQTGSNDYVESEAETDELKVAEAMEFKKEMFEEFHENMPDAKFVIMSGILLPGREEYVDMTLDINDQLKKFCEENDYMYFIDAESLTYDRETGSFVDNVESLFNDDQIHLTDESRIVWADTWMIPLMEQLELPVTSVEE